MDIEGKPSEGCPINESRGGAEMFGDGSHRLDIDIALSLPLPFEFVFSFHKFHLDPSTEFLVVLDVLAVDELSQGCFDLLVDL